MGAKVRMRTFYAMRTQKTPLHNMVEEGIVRAVRATMEENETQSVTFEHINVVAGADMADLVMAIRDGFLEKKNMLEEGLQPFFSMKKELYEVPFLHVHMMIPDAVRRQVLDILHTAH